MKLTGDRYEALCADLDDALRALVAPLECDPALWTRRPARRPTAWSAGGHVAHLALCLEDARAGLERALDRLRAGALPPPPRRGPLEALFVRIAVQGGRLPRGGRTSPAFEPPAQATREDVLARLAREGRRHRALGLALAPSDRDRLWAPNPFRTSWHYRLPEMVRMHAVHARHHAALVRDIAAG